MKQAVISPPQIEIRGYSIKELSILYQVSGKTIRKWIKEFAPDVGERVGHCYTPKQVEVIFKELGIPGKLHMN